MFSRKNSKSDSTLSNEQLEELKTVRPTCNVVHNNSMQGALDETELKVLPSNSIWYVEDRVTNFATLFGPYFTLGRIRD